MNKKYLKKFSTEADYNSAKANLDKPNVSLVVATMSCKYNPVSAS